jgi:asparagine synthase (glutamine-hydrolysing)
MLERTGHPLTVVELNPADVPSLAASVAAVEDEPYGGLPTLAYARLFERARALGVPVLLDGQGMDEQWAGYDYYARQGEAPIVQGTRDAPVRPECLVPEFAALAADVRFPEPFPDRLRNLQYRDARFTKLPRALRFNDRASMRSSVELREPFLDHRLVEMALRQPLERKIRGGTSKWMLRRLARTLAPAAVAEPPKRSVQTPQREWLRGPLRGWADDLIETALAGPAAGWLDGARVRAAWRTFQAGEGTNAFFVWQWVSLGLEGRHAEVYV